MKITTIRLSKSLEKIANKSREKNGRVWWFNVDDLDIVIKRPLICSMHATWEVKDDYKTITERLLEEYIENTK